MSADIQALDAVPARRYAVRATGKAGDYFGPCDHCGKSFLGEAYALNSWIERNGKVLAPNSAAYGHHACMQLRAEQGRAVQTQKERECKETS